MVILLCYTLAFSEVIYANFYAKILDWNFRVIDENSRILVVVFVSKLNFSFSFRFVDENYQIFVVVVVFVAKINLFSSTKIFVFVIVEEKKHCSRVNWCAKSRMLGSETPYPIWIKFCMVVDITNVITYANFGEDRLMGLVGYSTVRNPQSTLHTVYSQLDLPVPSIC